MPTVHPCYLYHASPVAAGDLSGANGGGLVPGSAPRTARSRMAHTYLGSLGYLESDFFSYCRPGRYNLYRVDVSGIAFDSTWKAPGSQWRTSKHIPGDRLQLVGTVNVTVRTRYGRRHHINWSIP